MSFREVRVYEVQEGLGLRGEGLRSVERLAGMDRKTVWCYVEAAYDPGFSTSAAKRIAPVAVSRTRNRNG